MLTWRMMKLALSVIALASVAVLAMMLILGAAITGATADSAGMSPASEVCVISPGPATATGQTRPGAGNKAAPAKWSSPDQLLVAKVIFDRGVEAKVGDSGIIIALMTAMQESGLRNLDHGDRDSLGPFQQRPSQGWGTIQEILNLIKSTDAFYGVAAHTNNPGLTDIVGWQTMSFGVAAQAVQRSAYPTLYAQHEPDARQMLEYLKTGTGGSYDCSGGAGPGQVSGTWAHPLAPASFTLTSRFGMRYDPVNGKWSMHRGQDFSVPTGTQDRAACDGVIQRADPVDPYGGGMQTDLDCGGGVLMKYMHQSKFLVSQGDQVKAGQVIGLTGTTGHSTGPHLHFQVNVNGEAVEPMKFMRERGIQMERS